MVTSQKDQIQSLIADIEQVLGKEKPRTPWVKASDVAPQRQALVRAQAYLMSLQQSFEAPGGWGPVDPTTGQIAAPPAAAPDSAQAEPNTPNPNSSPGIDLPPVGNAPSNRAPTDVSAAENVLQALLTEMSFLKSSALQPLRKEMDSLRSERDDLSQEVKTLAQQRNQALQELNQAQLEQAQLAGRQAQLIAERTPATANIDEQQLNEFLQVLMSRLQENLSVQVTETLGQLESEHSAAMAKLTAATEIEILELKPTGQIEEIRQIQSRSDQLLANIDSTLQRMFETLQTNIDSYQISLNEGIENMHSLGRQGEVIVRSLVDHLTQQLGQTAPPEPVFYPAQPSSFAESSGLGANLGADLDADTVSSLNEILPASASYVAVTDLRSAEVADEVSEPSTPESLASESSGSEPASETVSDSSSTVEADSLDSVTLDSEVSDVDISEASESVLSQSDITQPDISQSDASSDAATSATTQVENVTAENFIKEDGTIDLDLLKLDIDRTEDDPSLSRDDLMIDAAIADAEVAAAEAENQENLEIEAKVKPTADAAFLADLTFDDLVVDDATLGESAPIDAPEVPVTEVSVPDLVVNQDLTRGSETEERPESASVPDTPDDSSVKDELTVSPEQIDEVLSDDLISDDLVSDELVEVLDSANAEAERTALESPEGDLDILTSDLEEEIVFDEPLPDIIPLPETAEPPESALIPEQPEGDRPADAEPRDAEQIDAAQMTAAERVITQQAASSMDEPLVQNQFQNQFADTDNEADAKVDAKVDLWDSEGASDDEVSDDATTQFPPDKTPLATTQFSTADAFEASLDSLDVPESPVEADIAEVDVSEAEEDTAIPPVDFDDDLDGFLSDVSSEEAGESTEAVSESTAETAPQSPTDVERSAETADHTVIQPPEDEGEDDPTGGEPADWFLGIDLGATGLSAVLINQRGEQVYPLCWDMTSGSGSNGSKSSENESNRFRLPAVVQIEPQAKNGSKLGAVGAEAFQSQSSLLRNLKLMVKAGIPRETAGEPWIQWSDHTSIPLARLQASMVELLSTLQAERTSCRAVGLKNAALRRALSDLKGVIVGYPTNWPDTYSFNIREAVVASGLIESPSQVFFVEEAIAAVLSALPASGTLKEEADNQQPGLYNCNWSGGTVIISAGAVLTETAVANLPADLDQLSYQHFSMRGYTYAGDAIDQDIICQLLHMPLPDAKQTQIGNQTDESADSPADSIGRWETLGLSEISLPQPGEADRVTRHRLRQRLNDSPLGREAILTARELKMALQTEEEVEVELGDHTWVITRKELETKVFLPYIQRINRQVNALLSKQNLATQTVKQVVCTGGSASLGSIARWLRQKFPNATIIQDTYAGEYSNSCSRVAYGLANLCHYPNVLDVNRHQYNDYFLLLELLRILPEQPLPAGGILHLLEQRGINTQACQAHVLALIEGHLPPGLVPTSGDRPLISARATDIATYKALSELPLFRKQGGQIYIADQQQGERLRSHLSALLSTKVQSLTEPMSSAALMSATIPTS